MKKLSSQSGSHPACVPHHGRCNDTPDAFGGLDEDRRRGARSPPSCGAASARTTCRCFRRRRTYKLSGHQVLKKWLSYRERDILGRSLNPEEIQHFTDTARRIAVILVVTSAPSP